MSKIVFSDRDGTINRDEEYFLGSSPSWREQVSLLEGVVEGIKVINGIPGSRFFIVTNQSGVALRGPEFDELTEGRMHEVNRYLLDVLREQGCRVDGYFACPYVNHAYVEKARERGRQVNPDFVNDDHPDIKPRTGMMRRALCSLGLPAHLCQVYVIGDRASDVQMALNLNGTGILVESSKTRELHDAEKVRRMNGQVYVAQNFLEAAQYVARA